MQEQEDGFRRVQEGAVMAVSGKTALAAKAISALVAIAAGAYVATGGSFVLGRWNRCLWSRPAGRLR